MFYNCTSLKIPPKLPATTLAVSCYSRMFHNCSSLEALPELPNETLPASCYTQMFQGCTKIKLSDTQVDEYTISYRIPSTGTIADATNRLTDMFTSTGGTFKGTPEANTTYYLSNTNSIISAT